MILSLVAIFCAAVRVVVAAERLTPDWEERRRQMVAEIREDVIATRTYIGKGTLRREVLAAMSRVPRHAFVPAAMASRAYENRPLPIGHGQTISQPYIVALMTDLLEPEPGDLILEVGTGSGYQAAVLAELAGEIRTIEIIPELSRNAEAVFQRLGYTRIQSRQGDGYFGWPDGGRYDGIIVTAAADHVPPPLVRQLKEGGRMVIPVGERFSVQYLLLITKDQDGKVVTRPILPVRFVPLTGTH
jgi:protein-L-isoaspartate(D-aspartate) O-methyltransferase